MMATKKKPNYPTITVIGAGLAGSEVSYQLIRRGIPIILYEMRPKVNTGAHTTDLFAELVCSNSVGSNLPDRASGLLKEEMRLLGSYFMDTSYKYRVPAGNALAVDRGAFAREITRYIKGHALVDFRNEEIDHIPEEGMVILATGPLTSPALMKYLEKRFGTNQLAFYDAIAPIVSADSIDMTIAFKGNRYGDGAAGDYINCPMNKDEYLVFIEALLKAERIPITELEKSSRKKYFTACQPVEVIASTGVDSLRFGPMKPVGFTDPRTGERPYAVVQLRQDNLLGSLYNIVGFQTNLKHGEQKRVFKLIPGLKNAEFIRCGQMHRNTYLNSPKILKRTMQLKTDDRIFIAGQMTGVEGYTESAAMGLIAGFNVMRISMGKPPVFPPEETMIGALLKYITFEGHKKFHPMNANFGIFDIKQKMKSDLRRQFIVKRARKAFRLFYDEL